MPNPSADRKARAARRLRLANQRPHSRQAQLRVAAQSANRPRPLTAEERQAEQALTRFVELYGGRAAIIEALSVAGAGPEVGRLLSLLAHPAAKPWSVAKLCAQAGISAAEFFQLVGKARMAKAVLAAQETIATGLVAVVADVMQRAAPLEVPCPDCRGVGTLSPAGQPDAAPVTCASCRGTGRSIALPELDRQKVALDLAKLLPKGGAPMVAVQNNFAPKGGAGGGGFVPGGIEQLQQAVNDCLFAQPAALLPEAEVTEAAPEPLDADILPQEGDA